MKELQQIIVRVMRREVELAQERHIKVVAERAAKIASANIWDDLHPEDGVGGISMNPYADLSRIDQREIESRNAMARMQQAYNLAVDTFLS